MTAPTRYKLSKHVKLSEAESGVVLLDTKRGRYWQLNSTSMKVVTLLVAGSTVGDVIDALAAEMDAPRTRIESDVTNAINSMRKAGLIGKVRR